MEVILVHKVDYIPHIHRNGPLPDCLQWVGISNNRVDGYWSVDLKALKIGETSVLRNEATTILDTGSSVVVGPYDDVGYLADFLGAWCAGFAGSFSTTFVQVRGILFMGLKN